MSGMAKWQDWTSFALGLWLAVSPWAAGYSEVEAATCNAAFVGVALALGTHFEIGLDQAATEWANLGVGLWLLLAPFVLGFTPSALPAVNCAAVGGLVAVLAASALRPDRGVGRWLRRSPHIRV